jgi:catalase-peroxidase
VRTAWASASTYRDSDRRGGANGARIALSPQKDWSVNNPAEIAKVLAKLKEIQADFNDTMWRSSRVSLADLIVIGGAAAIEEAARQAGVDIEVPVVTGRGDATQAQTDVQSFQLLEPKADAFRNYYDANANYQPALEMLVDKADQLSLTVPEMTVLLGGMRVLGANADGARHGVFTDRVGQLTNDFFVHLLDNSIHWRKVENAGHFECQDASGAVKYTATDVDLIFGAHPELRAVAEVYAFDGALNDFVKDFVAAWVKVMRADRFDLK